MKKKVFLTLKHMLLLFLIMLFCNLSTVSATESNAIHWEPISPNTVVPKTTCTNHKYNKGEVKGKKIVYICTICKYKQEKYRVTSISITAPTNKVAAGKKVQLKASVSPKKAGNKKVTWKSSNTKVATVDKNGLVTLKKNTGGKNVTITATATDGSNVKKSYKITSMKGKVTKITISGEKNITVGKSTALKATVNATYGANKALKWTSSNTKYATVSSKGVVKALKAGGGKTVTITAAATDGSGKKATWRIKLKQDKWTELQKKYLKDKNVHQLIFVKYKSETYADVEMYQKESNCWKRILKCAGYVGRNGIDKVREGDKKTPTGDFGIIQAYGIKKNPGTKMNYLKLNKYHYYCGDSHHYNQLIDIREVPHNCVGEHLIRYVPHYNYGMFIDFNSKHEFKKGSAIFLHCTGSNPYTAGCVAVSEANMIKILKNAENGARICIFPK